MAETVNKKTEKKEKRVEKKGEIKGDKKKETLLGLTVKKTENFAEWYTQAIVRSEMIEYYDVSGCYILRPQSYYIWEQVQDMMNHEFKTLEVDNTYFPTFVSKQRLEAEVEHVAGFSPEVAWVTKYGTSDLAEPVAIRPTSETIMYPAFAKWIRSHRDLPLKVNQWCPIVRWEFKQPTPFIRTREFLWQEGHTAHATHDEAMTMVTDALDMYVKAYKELMAVPVIQGVKSDKEKFAGALMTTTVETFIPENGRAVQAATSHCLGQNFSKIFGVEFEDKNGDKQLVHQTSWGFTTRSIGVMVMLHGDDKGLVLPPRVARTQVVLVPIIFKEGDAAELIGQLDDIAVSLKKIGVRVHVDDRTNYTPGWKYNHWELKGVPIRLELGPRDMTNKCARLVRRDNGEKVDVAWSELTSMIPLLLVKIQNEMYERAHKKLHDSIVKISEFSEVMSALNAKKMVLAPWCEETESEEAIKKETQRLTTVKDEDVSPTTGEAPAFTGGMKSLCIPFDQPEMPEGTKCFFTGKPAKRWALWGRSY